MRSCDAKVDAVAVLLRENFWTQNNGQFKLLQHLHKIFTDTRTNEQHRNGRQRENAVTCRQNVSFTALQWSNTKLTFVSWWVVRTAETVCACVCVRACIPLKAPGVVIKTFEMLHSIDWLNGYRNLQGLQPIYLQDLGATFLRNVGFIYQSTRRHIPEDKSSAALLWEPEITQCFYLLHYKCVGHIATRYGLDGPGIESR